MKENIKKFLAITLLPFTIIFLIFVIFITSLFVFDEYIRSPEKKIVFQKSETAINNESPVEDSSQNKNMEEKDPPSLPEENSNLTLEIEWLSSRQEKDFYDIFDVELIKQRLQEDEVSWSQISSYYPENYFDTLSNVIDIYKIGDIDNDVYKDAELFYIQINPVTLGIPAKYRVIVKADGTKVVLSKYSYSEPSRIEQKFFEATSNLEIYNLETPSSLTIPGADYKLIKREEEPYKFFVDYKDLHYSYSTEDGMKVYRDYFRDCFVVVGKDGMTREYLFDLPFVEVQDGKEATGLGAIPVKLSIKFFDGTFSNNNEYIFQNFGGCGSLGSCYSYATYITDPGSQLVEVGKTSTGDPVYEISDLSLKEDERSDKGVLELMYDRYYPGWVNGKPKDKVSMEEFLKDRPLLIWQDPFGDFLEFRRFDYIPAVECGKPVIYLYPEKDLDVNVRVHPSGGFTITEPDYGNGWYVRASVDGKIYNYGDKLYYPYLFWEGLGIDYVLPEKGFVVARNNVYTFLSATLIKIGLNDKESADFLEYWVPKMTKYPYYFITFVDQQEFEKLAPLSVSPEPETVIRVFMDYRGLQEPIAVDELEIITPERKGFTVIEWGGALH